MTSIRRNLWVDSIFLASLYVWICAYSYPYFFQSLTNNYQEIITYNPDTAFILLTLKSALSSPWFHLRFGGYGHFYFNLTIATAYIYSLFLPLSDWTIIFILRLYALLGGCITIAIVFAFSRRFLGRTEAYFTAAIMAFSPAFVEYFNEPKPDTWQIVFITLSLYFLARAVEGTDGRPAAKFRFVLAAASAAGAAFGTKYLGILLIPLLAIAGWMVPIGDFSNRFVALAVKRLVMAAAALCVLFSLLGYWAQPPHVLSFFLVQPQHIQSYLTTESGAWSKIYWAIQSLRLVCVFISILCACVTAAYVSGFEFARYRKAILRIIIFLGIVFAFVATFGLTSPWLIWRLDFLPELYFRSDIEVSGDWAGFQWLAVLFGYFGYPASNYVSHGVGALTIFGMTLVSIALFRRKFRKGYLSYLFVLGFSAIFIALLIALIHNINVPHAFPIVPPFLLLAAFGLREIQYMLSSRLGVRLAVAATVGLAALLVAAQIWQGASILLRYKELVVALAPDDHKLGDWLVRCVPVETRMLGASASYVPPRFKGATMGEGYKAFVIADPNVVIVRTADIAIPGTLAESEKKYSKWDYNAPDMEKFYDIILRQGQWNRGPIFGRFQIFVKAKSGLSAGCR